MHKHTKRNLIIAATYAGVLLLGLLLGQNYADENHQMQGSSLLPLGLTDKTGKVQRMLDIISANYVDSINVEVLQDLAIDEIVAQLDPHSDYLRPKEARAQYETLEGSFEGIGIEYYNLNDTLMTIGLIAGGPAQKAGMRVGDKLITIDGERIAGVQITDSMIEKKIRGRRGTAIEIGIHRRGVDLPLPLKVARDKIEVSSIDAAYIIDTATAYIKVKRFGARTGEDFRNALENLTGKGAQRLILDLRENGGGYFSAATDLASQFFPDKQLIVYTQGANEPRTDYYSTAGGLFGQGRLVVLIDELSASGSEIVAGAIQDLDRGIIIGRRSFGKGLVQEQFGFGDGSALNLTIARYYTPLGRSIQKNYTINRAQANSITARQSNTDQRIDSTADSLLLNADLKYTTNAGRVVYGGGGIMPDIFVPLDSNRTAMFYKQIVRSNLIETYVYERLTESLPAYSVENFLTGYHLPDKDYHDFLRFVSSKGISYSKRDAQVAKQRVQTDIEALLGRYYFGSEAFFKVRNRSDQILFHALNAIKEKSVDTHSEVMPDRTALKFVLEGEK